MVRWGMLIDLDRCTACQACSFACSVENNCPFSLPEETAKGITMGWHEILSESEGTYPEVSQKFIPKPCMHCSNAPCTKVCPVGATFKRSDGITMQNPSICIGCRICVVACPYGARTFNWFDSAKRWPEPMDQSINPTSMPLRPKGVVEKCLFNYHRLDHLKRDMAEGNLPTFIAESLGERYRPGEEPPDELWGRAIDILMRYFYHRQATAENFDPRMTGYLPACIQVCPAKARIFGDRSNPESLVFELGETHRAFRLLEEFGTEPAVVYLT